MGGKNQIQMRADLRSDLKDSGSLWSDAELNRCVEKAVADLSRFLPVERMFEESFQFTVTDESITFPLGTDIDKIVDGADISETADGDTMTIAAQPDVPRPLTMDIGNDSTVVTTNIAVIVRGTDKDGLAVQETLHWSKGMAKATGTTPAITGKKYFKTVSEVEVDQIDGNSTGDKLYIGIGPYTDVWVYLVHKPIKYGSEAVTEAGATTVARDAGYYIDYINGRIKAITSGGISAAEACTIDYIKSQIALDISSLIDLIRVQQVEYPVGDIPQTKCQWDIFSSILTIVGRGEADEQASMSEDKHIAVYYDAEHIPPSDFAPGTIPEFLENTILMAAGAYALFVYALKCEHQAITDFASARTEMTAIDTDCHADLVVALDAAAAQLADANTALDKINVDGARTYLTDADTALDAAIVQFAAAATALGKINSDSGRVYLEDADGALDLAAAALVKITTYLEDNTNEDSVYWLTKITTDIASLRTAILAAADAANAYLDQVGVASTGDIALADAVRAAYLTTQNYVNGGSEPDILQYLTTGDALLNTVTVGGEGQDVPRAYAEYAMAVKNALVAAFENDRAMYLQDAAARTNAALGYVQEAAQRLSNLRSYIEQADGWGRVAAGFAAEARERINEAAARVGIADRYLGQASQHIANGQGYVAEAVARVAIADRYLGEAAQRVASANGYIAEGSVRLANIDRYIAEATRYEAIAAQSILLAEQFRKEGLERRNEVWSIWRDRKQYIGDFSTSSMRQMAK